MTRSTFGIVAGVIALTMTVMSLLAGHRNLTQWLTQGTVALVALGSLAYLIHRRTQGKIR
jgi:hypothetical protein